MANVAYIRVSTYEQNEGRQLEALKQYKIDKWFIDKCSGKNTDRTELKKLLEYVRENDIIYIESFSRLARNTKDLLEIIERLNHAGIIVKSLKESFDTSTPTGKLMLTMIGAIATFEREIILERQREGIALAKTEGKYKGRKQKEKPANWQELKDAYYCRKLTKVKLAETCGISRPILDRWLKEE